MCYVLILKIAVSAIAMRSVIIHQTSAFVILLSGISLYYSEFFVGGGGQGLVLFPA